ncbi:MAG: hypothetical protein A2X08_12355 [Bacteroidetes bacterium GWA2_32_17]|nr:MAG: hypothetical protein A2X08_12355 [Bacteroidetes bacterium GWA2_32_17]
MNKIKFYNVARFYKNYKNEILELTNQVFSTGQVLNGEPIIEAEKKIACLTNRKYAVTVGSCTDALFFSLIASGIKKGDEVLVPAFSFIASASAISRAGATPVFVDVNNDGSINFELAEKKITKKTKAIMLVQLYGKMIKPQNITNFTNKYNLIVIEDAAQALGSSNSNIPAGKIGLASCFSFDPSKIINAFGTGGVVVTDNEKIAKSIQILRVQGKLANSEPTKLVSCNSRISSQQAAIVYFQLNKIDEIISKRNLIANYYNTQLTKIESIRILKTSDNETWNYHKYPIFTNFRDELKNYLTENNIETNIHFKKILPEYSVFNKSESNFPISKQLTETELSLPIYPELTDNEISFICDKIINFFKSKKLC